MAREQEGEEEGEDESVYDEKGRAEMVADDELSAEEAGFMKGYEEADEEKEKKSDEDDEESEED